MYEKIAELLNEYMGYVGDNSDGAVEVEDVENYLRKGDRTYLENEEVEYIEAALENLL